MAREALFFPTIRVPHSDWFLHALLYWDRVHAIVPEELQTPRWLGWRMQNYVDAGLVVLVAPDEYVWHRYEFADELIEDLQTSPDLEEMRGRFAAGRSRQLHTGKASHAVFAALERIGLAARRSGHEGSSWWDVEEGAAVRYMAGLARVLTSADSTTLTGAVKPEMDPITDSRAHLRALLELEEAVIGREHELRTDLLELALPSLSGPLVATDIVAFKQQHHALLTDFREDLATQAIEIAAEPDSGTREARAKVLRDTRDRRVKEIEGRLAETDWKVDRKGSVMRIGWSFAKGVAGTVASGGGGAFNEAEQFARTVKGAFTARTRLGDVGPLAYAVAARRRFGVSLRRGRRPLRVRPGAGA